MVSFLQAREIQVLLPDILEALQDTNTHVVLKALLVLKNVMAHVERRKASGPALQLAEKLLPFFDHVSVLREPEPSAGPPVTRAALQPGPVGSTQAGPSQSPRQPRRWGALLGHGWCGWWRKWGGWRAACDGNRLRCPSRAPGLAAAPEQLLWEGSSAEASHSAGSSLHIGHANAEIPPVLLPARRPARCGSTPSASSKPWWRLCCGKGRRK